MENTTPFADAIAGEAKSATYSETDILRKTIYDLNLQVLELKTMLKEQSRTLELINNVIRDAKKDI